jgi:hypothetical protein
MKGIFQPSDTNTNNDRKVLQPTANMTTNTKMCFFCKNSGETESAYTGHTKHNCQKLANIECLSCGGKGHTERYCDGSGKKYTPHAPKKPSPADSEWQEVTKKAALVFHVGNNAVTSQERPVTPPQVDDETLFPSLTVEAPKPTAAKTLNFGALKFETPKVQAVVKPKTQSAEPKTQAAEPPATVVTSTVADADFPELSKTQSAEPKTQTPARRSPPTRSPPTLPTINESDVANMTQDEVVDTINSNITATEMAERTAQQLTGVISTLSTSLNIINGRYDAKCKEYDALLQAYNALVSVQETTSQWGERGSTSWADEPM